MHMQYAHIHTNTQCNYDYVCLLNATNNAYCVSRTQMYVCVRACARARPFIARPLNHLPDCIRIVENCNKHVKIVYHLKAHTILLYRSETLKIMEFCFCCCCSWSCVRVCFFLLLLLLFLSIIKTWCWRYDLRLNRISILLINALVLCASKHHTVCIRIHSYRQIQHDSTR